MASSLYEPPAVQIRRLQMENCRLQGENCRLQTENDRLHSENRRFRTERGSPEREEGANGRPRHENFYFPFDRAFQIRMGKRAEKEAEALWGKEDADIEDAVNPKKEKEDDADRLRSENRRLRAQNTLLKEAERAATTTQIQLEIENASLRKEEMVAEKAIRERNDLCEALRLAMAQCESLRRELDEKRKSDDADEKFAQLVEARIARDEAVEKMEDCMAYNKSLEERLRRHEGAVRAVCGRALRMVERVKELADGDAGEVKAPDNNEEDAGEKWIRVLMRPLEKEMEKIESSFSVKR